MKQSLKEFLAGAFGLIALYLVLANSGGFARSVTAVTGGAATDFQILQGRGKQR